MNKVVFRTTFCDPGYCIMITDDGSVIVIKVMKRTVKGGFHDEG